MSRLIDADELKKALVDFMDAFIDSDGDMMYSDHLLIDADYIALCDYIDKQPTVTPEPHWIPCSERLPEVGQDVMFSVHDVYSAEGCLRPDGDWWQFRWETVILKERVTAWCELPEPFKEVTT